MVRGTTKVISILLTISLLLLDLTVPVAKAQMIDTETAIAAASLQDKRARIVALLERQDVQQAMIEHGVDPEEARNRVASLTDDEVMQISQAMDQLPAGAGFGEALLVTALIVFLVLLFTDIMGYTDVFPFVKKGSGKK